MREPRNEAVPVTATRMRPGPAPPERRRGRASLRPLRLEALQLLLERLDARERPLELGARGDVHVLQRAGRRPRPASALPAQRALQRLHEVRALHQVRRYLPEQLARRAAQGRPAGSSAQRFRSSTPRSSVLLSHCASAACAEGRQLQLLGQPRAKVLRGNAPPPRGPCAARCARAPAPRAARAARPRRGRAAARSPARTGCDGRACGRRARCWACGSAGPGCARRCPRCGPAGPTRCSRRRSCPASRAPRRACGSPRRVSTAVTTGSVRLR